MHLEPFLTSFQFLYSFYHKPNFYFYSPTLMFEDLVSLEIYCLYLEWSGSCWEKFQRVHFEPFFTNLQYFLLILLKAKLLLLLADPTVGMNSYELSLFSKNDRALRDMCHYFGHLVLAAKSSKDLRWIIFVKGFIFFTRFSTYKTFTSICRPFRSNRLIQTVYPLQEWSNA